MKKLKSQQSTFLRLKDEHMPLNKCAVLITPVDENGKSERYYLAPSLFEAVMKITQGSK